MTQRSVDVIGRLAELESALGRLDRERLRWRRLAGMLAIGLGTLGIAGAAVHEASQTVEANEFILRDKEGRARAALTIRPDGSPGLAFFDEEQTMRLSLDLGPKGREQSDTPGVNVYDATGELRAAMTIRPDGTPGIGFFGKTGLTRLSLDMAADDSTGVNLYGAQGALRAAMAVRPDGTPGVGLFDEAGRIVQSFEMASPAPATASR